MLLLISHFLLSHFSLYTSRFMLLASCFSLHAFFFLINTPLSSVLYSFAFRTLSLHIIAANITSRYALYQGHLDCPPFPEDTFRELMLLATRGVEFSFNNQMYKPLDGMATGSPLGPALANILVGFHESRLFDNTAKPGVYIQFVDDTFAIFGFELGSDHFQEKLNFLTSSSEIHSREGAKQLLEFSRCFGRKRVHWISYQHLQETDVYCAIHPLDFL